MMTVLQSILPAALADGTQIHERDISSISSTRHNPVHADIFGRLGYMERQGILTCCS